MNPWKIWRYIVNKLDILDKSTHIPTLAELLAIDLFESGEAFHADYKNIPEPIIIGVRNALRDIRTGVLQPRKVKLRLNENIQNKPNNK